MAKILSFLSWNVENFSNKRARVDRVVDQIANENPDVFALYEVKGAAVFSAMVEKMPNYHFTITETANSALPEILVGVRNSLTSFVTQRDELQSKVPTLRPGALATITKEGQNYSFLFLHLKSFDGPRDWGLRDDMFAHVSSLKRKIDKITPNNRKANFVALGDINTMGMDPSYNDKINLDGAQELAFVDKRMGAKINGMRRLEKTHAQTWWNGKDNWEPSSLDHVYAAEHLTFKKFGAAEVAVKGWVEETTASKKKAWIEKFSDHCLLYGELHR
ncbi:MAG: endonuclease/exonuclease/phosphatase family protein [Pseudomonadota bacterium]